MSSKEVGTQTSERRRRWVSQLVIFLIALVLSAAIISLFFTSGAISR
jgi:hypothetical protein